MEDDERKENDSGHQHGAGREGVEAANEVGAAELSAGLVGTAGQCECTVDVQNQCDQQDDSKNPQDGSVWQERGTDLAQERAVDIDLGLAWMRRIGCVVRQEDLQVSDHVNKNEATEDKASDGHGQLHCPGRVCGTLTQRLRRNFSVTDCLTVGISNSHGTSSVVVTVRPRSRH